MNEDASATAALQKVKAFLRVCEERSDSQAQATALSLDDSISQAETAEQWECSSIAQEMRQRLNEVERIAQLRKNGTEAEKERGAAETCALHEKVRVELAEQKILIERLAAQLEN